MITIDDVNTLRDRLGRELAVSDWIDVPQERIDRFAEATDDRQWIHVDPARAAAESPYHATIAHGFLTLSLMSTLARRAMSFTATGMAVNYGLNRVRFMSAVPAGARVRGRFTPMTVDEAGNGLQVTWRVTVEREHADKPCCVAEWLVRYYPEKTADF